MEENLSRRITEYWDRRAPSYTEVVRKNLADGWDAVWADMLVSFFPEKAPETLRVLDIGTGPGFYAIILAARGYCVTAGDFSEEMLLQAQQNAGALAGRIDFRKLDAQKLELPDESFDAIVTRNLTWNLPDPEAAYREWKRVLRPGGTLQIFDANWYAYLVDEEKKAAFQQDRENTRRLQMEDHDAYPESRVMEEISRSLPMTGRDRPEWDLSVLRAIGFRDVSADLCAGDRVWNEEEKINYASTPGFLIRARKQEKRETE